MGNLMVFNGGLMRGQSAHWKLRGATFLEQVRTAPCYRLFSIDDRHPAMLRDDQHGVSIAAELYLVPDDVWPGIRDIEPPGLYRGPVELADGRALEGMLGEGSLIAQRGKEISSFGGWGAYPYRARANRSDGDPATPAFELFVNGTLMRGLALHGNLQNAPFLGCYRTTARYRVHSIDDVHPGMYRVRDGEPGVAVEGELYLVAEADWPALEASEPPNLYRGRVTLQDQSEVWGILYPRELAEGRHPDISAYGGWVAYTAARAPREETGVAV